MSQESFESSDASSNNSTRVGNALRSRIAGPFAANSDFLKCWFGQGISYLGTQISLIAVPIIAAVTLDASPMALGVLYACGQLPALLFGLFAGAWLDRRRRRPVMVGTDLARTVLTLVVPAAAWFGWLSIPLLCVVLFGLGTLTIFFDIAHLSYVPSLIDRSQLVAANSRLEATASGAQVVGPAVGGALVGLLTGPGALLIDAGSFVVSAIALRSIRKPEATPAHIEQGEAMRERIASGLRFVRANPALRALAGCSAVTNLFGYAFLAVYVAFMVRELGLSDFQIGLVFATGGVGALIGSTVAGRCADRFGTGRTLIAAQLGFGLTGLLVPLAVLVPSVALPLVVAAEFLQWLTLLIYAVNAVSLRQRVTSDEMQGRLHATFAVLTRGFQPIGSILGGIIASVIGLSLTLVVSEIGLMLGVLFLIGSPLRHNAEITSAATVSTAEAVS
jgi:MFS family permease